MAWRVSVDYRLLGLEGLLHYTLVMEYDILMSYAVTAFIVAFIVRLGDKFMTGAFYFLVAFTSY